MRYVTSHERIGFRRGFQEGFQEGLQEGFRLGFQQAQSFLITLKSQEHIIIVLQTRFAAVPDSITSSVKKLYQQHILDRLLKKAVTTPSLDDFLDTLTCEKIVNPLIPHV